MSEQAGVVASAAPAAGAGCDDCAAALRAWPTCGYRASCRGCAARMLARGVDFAQCRAAGALTPAYRAALGAVGVSHAEVKAWAALDAVRCGAGAVEAGRA